MPHGPEAEPYLHAQGGKTGPPSSSSSESDEEKEDQVAGLLKEAYEEASTTSDEEEEATGKEEIKKEKVIQNVYEVPAGNLAVLVMGCWMMRVPVMYKDLIRKVSFWLFWCVIAHRIY